MKHDRSKPVEGAAEIPSKVERRFTETASSVSKEAQIAAVVQRQQVIEAVAIEISDCTVKPESASCGCH